MSTTAPFSNRTILAVLTIVNVLNFLDRGIVPGASNEFNQFIDQSGIHHDEDVYLGLLQSSFIVGYAVSSIIFGHIIHYYPPFKICLMGMIVWVMAVTFSGLSYYSHSYVCLFLSRMLSGVGEASFQCSIPPWIAKYAGPSERGTWLSIFYTAIPVGTAVGYAYSAALAESIGWQWAFFIEGVLMLVFFPFFMAINPHFPCESVTDSHHSPIHHNHHEGSQDTKPPLRLSHSIDHHQQQQLQDQHQTPTIWEEAHALAIRPVYICLVLGYAAQTGALIGVSTFGSAFLMGLGYFDSETASSSTFGALISIAGIIATPLGGILLDRMSHNRSNKYAKLREQADAEAGDVKVGFKGEGTGTRSGSGIGGGGGVESGVAGDQDELLTGLIGNSSSDEHDAGEDRAGLRSALQFITICSIFGAVLLCCVYFMHDKILFMLFIGLGSCFIFLTYSGISIALMLCVPLKHRAFAIGISCLCLHVFGDVPSPVVAGLIKDHLAPDCAGSGDAVAITDACRSDGAGLRLTMLIVTSWLFVTVFFFTAAWLLDVRSGLREARQDSKRAHDLQDSIFSQLDVSDHDYSTQNTSSSSTTAGLPTSSSLSSSSSSSSSSSPLHMSKSPSKTRSPTGFAPDREDTHSF